MSLERECEFCNDFPHESDAALAKRYGITVRQAQYLGFKSGLHKTAATRSASRRHRHVQGPALTDRVHQLVEQAGKSGISRDCVERIMTVESPSSISNALNKLTAGGRIHRMGTKGKSRWFSAAEQARDFAAELTAAKYRPAPEPTGRTTRGVHITPAKPPALLPGEPDIPASVCKQIGKPVPGPEGRWHTNARPIFSGLGPGLYTDAPSSWVNAITAAR